MHAKVFKKRHTTHSVACSWKRKTSLPKGKEMVRKFDKEKVWRIHLATRMAKKAGERNRDKEKSGYLEGGIIGAHSSDTNKRKAPPTHRLLSTLLQDRNRDKVNRGRGGGAPAGQTQTKKLLLSSSGNEALPSIVFVCLLVLLY